MIKEKYYDVIIAGGGPGGLATAKILADNDINVIVLEKRLSIGSEKRCAEGTSLNTLRMIEKKIGKIPGECIAQKINGAIVYAPNGEEVLIDFGKEAGAVLRRKFYDKWLAIKAASSGARIYTKAEVLDVIKENNYVTGVKVRHDGKILTLMSKVLVAADGVETTIARKAGLDTTHKPSCIDSGYQYEMANLKLRDPLMIELMFGNEIAPRGYVWIFPKGKDVANVGVGVANTDKPAKYYLDKFIEEHQDIFSRASVIEVNAGGIPVGGLLKNMVLNGFLAVGDAAHQVNPIHGGGIKEALIAGDIAAGVITKAIREKDYSQKRLSEYNKIWWAKSGHSLKKVERFRNFIEKLTDKHLNKIAKAVDGDDLVAFTRGKNYLVLLKIFAKNPTLIFLLIKLIK